MRFQFHVNFLWIKKKNGFWVTNYRIYSIEYIFLRLQQSRAASYKLFTFCLWPRWKMAMWKTNSGALLQCGGVPSISCAESWSQEFFFFFSSGDLEWICIKQVWDKILYFLVAVTGKINLLAYVTKLIYVPTKRNTHIREMLAWGENPNYTLPG